MALSRRTGTRFQASIWPGFVDAMTGLLLVLMFLLTIFMVVQYVLRETITGQESVLDQQADELDQQANELDQLTTDVASLAEALGLERDRTTSLDSEVGELSATIDEAQTREAEQARLIATLQSVRREQDQALNEARTSIASFEEQVSSLLAARDTALGQVSDLEGARDVLLSEQDALQLALAGLRDEVDAQAETARLAAARRQALDALVADLERRNADRAEDQAALTSQVTDLETQLSEEEKTRLLEAAASDVLRERLKNADAELTAMTLSLEEQRRDAEETLAILAAAKLAAEQQAGAQLSKAEQRAALLAVARDQLAGQAELTTEAQKQQELLNQQVAALRQQLSGLQDLLDDSEARDTAAKIQLQSLGKNLNIALARAAAEERKTRRLEEEKTALLEAEKEDLEKYRSEFFGRLRDLLGAQDGVQIVGDRFIFSSEVLFAPGQADISTNGQIEIAKVATILYKVIGDIPENIDWVIQVDGHTDDVPLIGGHRYADNWELSQARALSVVRYMIDTLDLPPNRLSANGFGQYQPINPADTPEARAQNRRIELKLTEK